MNLVVFVYVERGASSFSLPKQGTVLIGRGLEAEVFVASDDASRRHAQLQVEGLDVTLTDLGSRNGTFVNGERIQKPRRVHPGDQILVGDAILMLERESHSVPPLRDRPSERRRPTTRRSRPS
ncbi:MAG: FHA domain-containing protein [Polyangiaceae bacterium]|nr:FHA domain-containing protein [Polyangiaceae bacterium]